MEVLMIDHKSPLVTLRLRSLEDGWLNPTVEAPWGSMGMPCVLLLIGFLLFVDLHSRYLVYFATLFEGSGSEWVGLNSRIEASAPIHHLSSC